MEALLWRVFLPGVALALMSLAIWLWRRQGVLRAAVEAIALVLLPVIGAWANASGDSCSAQCGVFYRPLAQKQLEAFLVTYFFSVMAYGLSRTRDGKIAGWLDRVLVGMMAAGLVLLIPIAIQISWVAAVALGMLLAPEIGFVVVPFVLGLAAVPAIAVLYGCEIRRRLDGANAVPVAALVPAVLGAHVLANAWWLGAADGAIQLVTRTCGYPLSQLPLPPEVDCGGHYLCTVAARGHPTWVRPLRIGVRRGKPIVVNRQLAIANAFEDLLHERWPRFGRFARRAYDRLGLPVSRWIRSRWMADLLYLSMKPAEYLFYAALVWLDGGRHEERIDRMYR